MGLKKMTIQKLHLPIKAVSKPRGKLGKGGHIYHQSKEYAQYQHDFIVLTKSCGFSLISQDLECVAIKFGVQPGKRGRKNDLDNMSGAVLDALVKGGVISDDNYGVVKQLYSSAVITPHPYIEIYFTFSKKELLYVMDKFF